MSPDDEDFEQRLRDALTTPRASDRVDVEAFLGRVHHGARVRRVRRTVSIVAASAVVVAGGAVAVQASGVLRSSSRTPIAGQPTKTRVSGLGGPGTSTPPASTKQSKATATTASPTEGSAATVTISPGGPYSAAEIQPLSLSATGTQHQWVLGKTPGGSCGKAECATLFSTIDHGQSWVDLGTLPAAPATADDMAADTVSQIRVTGAEGVYDEWAFGHDLWSSHDSGRTWSTAHTPRGQVTALESWGDYVYAGVSSPVRGSDTATLYRSPVSRDVWKPVKVGRGLTSVLSLAAAKGVVGLIDLGDNGRDVLYVSHNGQRWSRQAACPTGTEPVGLSTASDASGIGALWVSCQGLAQTVVRFTTGMPGAAPTAGWKWSSVKGGEFTGAVTVAAHSTQTAYVVGGGLQGIERVSTQAAPKVVYPGDVGTATLFGFTNASHGYLLNEAGQILATIDGGTTWKTYSVSGTKN